MLRQFKDQCIVYMESDPVWTRIIYTCRVYLYLLERVLCMVHECCQFAIVQTYSIQFDTLAHPL